VQGSRIMAILASQGIQIPPAHVGMAFVPIVATSTSQSVERSVASALGVDGLQGTRILQLLDSKGTAVEARLALAREREVFDTYMLHVDEPIVDTKSEAVHGLSLSHTLVEVQSTFVKGVPNFHTVAVIEGIEDTRTVLLAQITSYPAIDDHSRVLHLMTLDPSSGLYFPSLTYAQHPTWSLVSTSMEIVDISGGFSLRSP
jgi:hypothetical protein